MEENKRNIRGVKKFITRVALVGAIGMASMAANKQEVQAARNVKVTTGSAIEINTNEVEIDEITNPAVKTTIEEAESEAARESFEELKSRKCNILAYKEYLMENEGGELRNEVFIAWATKNDGLILRKWL